MIPALLSVSSVNHIIIKVHRCTYSPHLRVDFINHFEGINFGVWRKESHYDYSTVPFYIPTNSELTIYKFGTEKAWDDGFTAYWIRGIAKRLKGNKQSAPTPYRISIPLLSGSGYTTSMSVFFDCLAYLSLIGDFRIQDKAKTLLLCQDIDAFVNNHVQRYEKYLN